MDAVQKLTGKHLLVVFSDSTCPYCKTVIQALGDADLQAHIQDINGYKTILKGKTGQSSAPSVWVGDKFVGGCNDGPEPWMGVVPNLKKGKLQRWVKNLDKARSSSAASTASRSKSWARVTVAIMSFGKRKGGKGAKGGKGSTPVEVLESAEWLLLRPATSVLEDKRVASLAGRFK
jgi:glutaredoxin 3